MLPVLKSGCMRAGYLGMQGETNAEYRGIIYKGSTMAAAKVELYQILNQQPEALLHIRGFPASLQRISVTGMSFQNTDTLELVKQWY